MKFLREIFEKNRKFLVVLVLVPAVVIGIIGLIFGDGVRDVPLAVVDKDTGMELPFMGEVSVSQQFLDKIDRNIIRIVKVDTEEEAMEMVRKGEVLGVIVFPENFTKEMLVKVDDPSYQISEKIRIKLDKSSMIVSGVVVSTLMNTFMGIAKQSESSPLPVEITTAVGIENIVFGDYIVSGIITVLTFIMSVVGVAMVIITNRQKITFGKYSSLEIVVSYLAVFTLAVFISMVLMYSVSVPLFKINVNDGIWTVLPGTLIFLLASVSIGILIGIASKDYEGIRAGVVISVLPILFGNVIIPMEAMPSWLRPVVYIFPPYYGTRVYRLGVLKQLGVSDMVVEIVVLSVFFIVFFITSFVLLGKKIRDRKI
ncbi:MAG: ABC transporter permease [Brevinematales bacterium]|nr:ABC transporter permease [Brevinematales bacterium]